VSTGFRVEVWVAWSKVSILDTHMPGRRLDVACTSRTIDREGTSLAGTDDTDHERSPSLIERAREKLRRDAGVTEGQIDDPQATLRSLELHRVELELQNDELQALRMVGLLTLDEAGRVLEANDQVAELLGRARSALVGEPLAEFVDPYEAERFELYLRRVRGRDEAVDEEFRLARSDGWRFRARLSSVSVEASVLGPLPESSSTESMSSPDGPNEIIVAITDHEKELVSAERLEREVAAHRLSRSELDAARAHLAAVVDTAAESIVTIDPRGTIEYVNPMTEEMFGYGREELVGQNVRLLMPSPHRDEHDGYLADYRSGTSSDIVGRGREVEALRRDGSTFPAHLAVSEMRVDGQLKFTGMIRDLTEQKALERQLVQAQRTEAIGSLASGVAHDFNNLIMGVAGCLELASRTVDADNPAQTFLDEARRSLQSGAAISRQLLAFGRGLDTKQPPCVVDQVVASVGSVFGPLLGEDVRLQTSLGAGDVVVCADRGHLEQILVNLAINARDAMTDGGTLTVETDVVDYDAPQSVTSGDLQPGRYARITVTDTGDGIPEELLPRIFEPFFTTKSAGRGSGLGLSMVFGTLRSLGGAVHVDSVIDEGSAFELFIPVADPTAQAVDTTTSSELTVATPRECTVLVVEDDPLVLQAVRQQLVDQGHTPIVASSAEAAQTAMQKQATAIDLVLTDSVLTDGFGADVFDAAAELVPHAGLVFMSAHGRDALSRQGRVYDGHPFIQKPFSRAQLQDALARALASPAAPTGQQSATPRAHKILTVDDESMLQMVVTASLTSAGYEVLQADSVAAALEMPLDEVALLIADVKLPDGSGPELAARVSERQPHIAVVHCSGMSREKAIANYDLDPDACFLAKPFDLEALLEIVGRVLPQSLVDEA